MVSLQSHLLGSFVLICCHVHTSMAVVIEVITLGLLVCDNSALYEVLFLTALPEIREIHFPGLRKNSRVLTLVNIHSIQRW